MEKKGKKSELGGAGKKSKLPKSRLRTLNVWLESEHFEQFFNDHQRSFRKHLKSDFGATRPDADNHNEFGWLLLAHLSASIFRELIIRKKFTPK